MKQISADQLKHDIESGKDITVINVLPEKYYQDCHIAGSTNIDLENLESAAKDWDKNKYLVVYCAHFECDASRKAWTKLNTMNFTNVFAYEGGMLEWKNKGFATQGACSMDYLNKTTTQDKKECSQCRTCNTSSCSCK